jgi:uncharacterized protein (DUF1330 family)
MLHARRMREIVESHGGRFIWSGRVDSIVIGDAEVAFQVVGLVEYPSRRKFVEIATSERVREIGGDRAGGLESQWLLAATTNRSRFTITTGWSAGPRRSSWIWSGVG